MWIREEPDIHHDVGVERDAVLETEALHGDLQTRRARVIEGSQHALFQLVDVEVARVDDQIGGAAHRIEHRPLELDRLDEALGLVGEWVASSCRVVTPHQLRCRRVEEQNGDPMGFRAQLGGVHIRKTPNFGGGIGALNAADRPSASACRVFAGSRMPSSHSRAVE
jgi:hypothetical protein